VKKRRRGEARFDGQYWRANVDPSDRYVLSLPGSTRFRISPLDDSYDNMAVAGDWTDSGLNMGCVESAVMSGRLASQALSQSPPLEEIVGFDHP
jgi:predicted NAD/FAD-dependent oxidoreductase